MRRAAALALAGAVAVAGCASSSPPPVAEGAARVSVPENTTGYAGAVLDEPYALPQLTFTDTGGRPFDLVADTRAPVTIVFFGYTHCPDVCGAVLADASSALRRADADVRERTELLFVTTDPARDTPEVIRDYLDRFDPAFVGLTGDMTAIEEAAEELGVALTGTEELPGGGYDVGHGAQLVGFGPDRRGRLVWTPGTTVGDLRDDITRLSGKG